MGMHKTRFRGVAAVRADSPSATLEDFQKALAEFRSKNDERLESLDKRMEDVVLNEHVDRINADVQKLHGVITEQNQRIAAMSVGAGGGGEAEEKAAKRAYSKAFSQYFRKGIDAGLKDLEVKAALTVGTDSEGGYTVPEEMSATVEELLRTISAVRSVATVMPVGSASYKKLVNTQGSTTGWVGETEARTETTAPSLASLEFPVMEIYANPAATRSVLDDSSLDLGAWLANEIDMEFAEAEGAAFVSGNGVNRPRGLTSYSNVANASYVWGKVGYIASGAAGAFGATDPADALVNLIHALRPGYRSNARFMMNDLTMAEVRKMKAGDGHYLLRDGLAEGQPTTILGYPIVIDENFAAYSTANAYAIAFADFARAYLIVDRFGIRVIRDDVTNKPYVHFYTTKRVGGGIQNFEAIKLFKMAAS